MLYSSGPWFVNIVSFLQEKREEGGKEGEKNSQLKVTKGLWVHTVEKTRAITMGFGDISTDKDIEMLGAFYQVTNLTSPLHTLRI